MWRATPTPRPRWRPIRCARAQAPIATPIEWAELEDAKLGPQRYTVRNTFRRLARKRDPWAEIQRHARPVHAAQERLAALAG